MSQNDLSPTKRKKDVLIRGPKKKKLALFIMRMAPKIIQFARLYSKTCRRRNSHQVLLFPESKNYSAETSFGEANRSLVSEYQKKYPEWYPFYFSDCKVFIDNHHLQIFKPLQSIPYTQTGNIVCFGSLVSCSNEGKNENPDNGTIFFGTENGNLLIINQEKRCFASFEIPEKHIKLISVYKEHILVVCGQNCYILSYQILGTPETMLQRLQETKKQAYSIRITLHYSAQLIKGEQAIDNASFLVIKQSVFLFYTTSNGLFFAQLKEQFLSNIQKQRLLAIAVAHNPFTNLKIHYQKDLERVLIITCCTQEIMVYSYRYSDQKLSVLYKMINPKNPPSMPKSHTPNCVEFIVKQQEEGEQKNRQYILIALSFTERIYFIRVWADYCELSKRAKFYNRIFKMIPYGTESLILLMQKDQDIDSASEIKVRIILVSLASVISFNFEPIHTETIDKIEFDTVIKKKLDSRGRARTGIHMVSNKQILILGDSEVNRIGLMTWADIYISIQDSESLQLLYFLILLKKYHSPFLTPPQEYTGLQQFMNPFLNSESCGTVLKQALLEYYYEIGMEPPHAFEAEIQINYPELFLPFILQHKISNLSDHCKELLVDYWRIKDDRIVLQLIVGGVEYGWELAIKKGWMRALHRIVEMGIQVHFPLLKLSSFIITQSESLAKLQRLYDQESQEYNEEVFESQLNTLKNYCFQFIDYASFAITNFLQPETLSNLDDLQEFLMAFFRNNILQNCIRYQPIQSARVISKLFQSPSLCNLIDKLDIKNFIEFDKSFSALLRTDYLSVSEALLSHFSESYREITSSKKYFTAEKRSKLKHQLMKEHAKLLNFSNNNSEGRVCFKFLRGYIYDMLIILVSQSNTCMKELLWQQKIEMPQQELQCYVQDYLSYLWNQLKKSPSSDPQISQQAFQPLSPGELKECLGAIQHANGSNSYLIVQILSSIPNNISENYCPRILRKFLQSPSRIIQNRVFDWLMVAMREEQNYKYLSKQLMNHLETLIEINKEKSRKLFDEFFKNREKEIIKRIGNAPLLQLEYLEMIIEEYNESIEDYYLNLHLNLLLHEQPSRVVSVLEDAWSKKVKYDLHEALKISLDLEYPDKNRVETYLFEKLGDVERCVRSYLKILEQLLWEYADLYESTSEISEEKEKRSSKNEQEEYQFTPQRKETHKLSMIINGLMQSNKILSHNQSKLLEMQEQISNIYEELLELIFRQPVKKYEYISEPLNSLLSFSEEVRTQKLREKAHYNKMIGYYLGKIIVEAFQKGYLNFFVKWMKKQNRIGIHSIKKHLVQGYQKVTSQATLLQNMSVIDENVLVQNIKNMLQIMELSIYSENVCPICTMPFEETDEALLFNCGHLFHKNCIEEDENGDDFCWQCIWDDQIKAMVDYPDASLVKILNKYCMKKSTNREVERNKEKKPRVVTVSQKRMNRLGIFDKKVTSLRDQAEILDMQLQIQDFYRQEAYLQ